MARIPPLGPSAARLLGSALGGVLAVAANAPTLLGRRQPLHQRGTTWAGVWRVHAPWPESGVDVLADAVSVAVSARTSRAVGLPAPWPDVGGFAVRFPDGAALLFASTGLGPRTRRLLAPRRPGGRDPLTMLLPLHTRLGRVDLGARVDGATVRVQTSLEGGPWVERATVRLAGPVRTVVRFDPLRLPRGLAWSRFWAAARRPAYAVARRAAPGAV